MQNLELPMALAQRIANLLNDPRTVGPTGEAMQIVAALQNLKPCADPDADGDGAPSK